MKKETVAVVVPCYQERNTILDVVAAIGSEVDFIFVVDDGCPDNTGVYVKQHCSDPRVEVLFHEKNQGVGAATKTGYTAAKNAGATIAVKLDGDGQMDCNYISKLVKPILEGKADYTKGNRFFSLAYLRGMPFIRLVGNTLLSLVTKASTGYWNLMDPTNGFTAFHLSLLDYIDVDKIDEGFFFESDILYRLGLIRAVVKNIPMPAIYNGEKSHLNILRVCAEFPFKHLFRLFWRILHQYFVRELSAGSLQLVLGVVFLWYGIYHANMIDFQFMSSDEYLGSTFLFRVLMPFLLGTQFLISALNWDFQQIPDQALHSQIAHEED